MQFKYSLKNRLFFYWTYFFSKTFLLWFEVKKPKFAMFIHEMRYSLNKFKNASAMSTPPLAKDYVETVFGKLHIRPHSSDMSIVSPAYERSDRLHLLILLRTLTALGRKILFLDIGAHIGAFSIMAGSRFRQYKNLQIIAFEPDLQKYQILQKNVICNNLKETIETKNVFLSSIEGGKAPHHFRRGTPEEGNSNLSYPDLAANNVLTHTLDSLLGDRIKDFDSIVIKIDTDGSETQILQGGTMLFKTGVDIHLLVEDFINHKIVTYLEDQGASFVTKLTPYNSWWKM